MILFTIYYWALITIYVIGVILAFGAACGILYNERYKATSLMSILFIIISSCLSWISFFIFLGMYLVESNLDYYGGKRIIFLKYFKFKL